MYFIENKFRLLFLIRTVCQFYSSCIQNWILLHFQQNGFFNQICIVVFEPYCVFFLLFLHTKLATSLICSLFALFSPFFAPPPQFFFECLWLIMLRVRFQVLEQREVSVGIIFSRYHLYKRSIDRPISEEDFSGDEIWPLARTNKWASMVMENQSWRKIFFGHFLFFCARKKDFLVIIFVQAPCM